MASGFAPEVANDRHADRRPKFGTRARHDWIITSLRCPGGNVNRRGTAEGREDKPRPSLPERTASILSA